MDLNRVRLVLVLVQGGLAFSCAVMVILGLKPIYEIAPLIYGWADSNTKVNYSMASSAFLISGLGTMLFPAHFVNKKLGRLNSLRLAHSLNIIGCALMVLRKTEGLIIGRSISGVGLAFFLFNAVPYVLGFASPCQVFLFGGVAVTISRVGSLCHALSAKFYSEERIQLQNNFMLTIFIPALISAISLILSLLNNYDSPESVYSRLGEEALVQYYAGFLSKERVSQTLFRLKNCVWTRRMTLADYLADKSLLLTIGVCALLILARLWSGSLLHFNYVRNTFMHFQKQVFSMNEIYVIMAVEIPVLAASTCLLYFTKRPKLLFICGCLALCLLNCANGILVLKSATYPVRYLLWLERGCFNFCLETVVHSYVSCVLPAAGYSLCYAFFFLLSLIGAQTYPLLVQRTYAVPFFIFAGIPLLCAIALCKWMQEYDQVADGRNYEDRDPPSDSALAIRHPAPQPV